MDPDACLGSALALRGNTELKWILKYAENRKETGELETVSEIPNGERRDLGGAAPVRLIH